MNMVQRFKAEGRNAEARAYGVWVDMRRRRKLSETRADYACYRNVTVDPRWNSFQAFVDDMGLPELGMSLERENGALGYSPSNCRWATAQEQSRNRPGFVKLSVEKAHDIRRRYDVGDITQSALADEHGVSQRLISLVVNGKIWS